MTFDEICDIAQLTPAEREDAAWFLGAYRMRRTYEELMKTKKPKTKKKEVEADVTLKLSMDEYQTVLQGLDTVIDQYGGTSLGHDKKAQALKDRLIGNTDSSHG